ncbi:MAG: PilZ domain-containing protein [Candidatus Electrothrix sp. ATG2]|nr:PilZ domain-containing protein [Candidatus Electrothrix sp. ATG2]
MKNINNRRFSRVGILWAVHLEFQVNEYKSFVHNVSLSGLFIEGDFAQANGDLCIINLKQSALYKKNVIRAVASVSRFTENGIALEFLSMKLDSFSFLQTILLRKAVQPAEVSREFLMNDCFKLDGEIIHFFPHRFNQTELKQWSAIL